MQNTGPDQSGVTQVAVGIIRNEHNQVLISQRPQHVHQANKWEFPGGKIELNETPVQALARELKEELGINSLKTHFLSRVTFDYGDKLVCLNNYLVDKFEGTPTGLEGQPVKWIDKFDLMPECFPEANRVIINQLQLPDRIQITGRFETFQQLEEKVIACINRGLKIIHFRAHQLNDRKYVDYARRLSEICRSFQVKLILNRDADIFKQVEADGLHLTHERASRIDTRPINTDRLFSVSCHNSAEIIQASKLGADYLFLSPLKTAISHDAGEPLGLARFRELLAQADCPVFALGGVQSNDVKGVQQAGGAGVAMISEFWS